MLLLERPRPNFQPGSLGCPINIQILSTTSLFCLLLYEEIPSYPNEGVVHSFKFTLRSFALKILTDCTPPFPMATTGRAPWATPGLTKLRPMEQMGRYEIERNLKQNYAKRELRNEREQASPNGATPS